MLESSAMLQVPAGDKMTVNTDSYLNVQDETVEAIKEYNVAIKGPLTTPVGKGIRSLNVAWNS